LYADGGNGSLNAKNDLHLGKLQGMFRAARNVLRNAKPLPLQGTKPPPKSVVFINDNEFNYGKTN
jgi:hypothetical protein